MLTKLQNSQKGIDERLKVKEIHFIKLKLKCYN